MNTHPLLAATLCLFVLGAAACGSSDSTADPGGPSSPAPPRVPGDSPPAGDGAAPLPPPQDGGTTDADAAAGWMPGPSCEGLAATCGAGAAKSCCDSSVVTGGTFKRGYDGVSSGFTDPSFVATVSNFRLDTYEITVGRFRKFVAGYPGNMPTAGAGKNPKLSSDTGWDPTWATSMAPTQAALKTALACNAGFATWTDAPGANESKAINCPNWYETYAFCIWDGGRLPTEAEWNYAAAAGSEQRAYPWSSPANSLTIDGSFAVVQAAAVAGVGSKSPKGDGKWGQADMAGNVLEWTRDWLTTPYPSPCADCQSATPTGEPTRVTRGGHFASAPVNATASWRNNGLPAVRYATAGGRCARNP